MIYIELSKVADINPRLPKDTDENQEVSFLPMAAVSEKGYVNYEEKRILKDVKKGFTYFERGDFLIAKITPCFENGKAALTCNLQHAIGYGSTEFHVIRPHKNQLDKNYLFHLLWNEKFRFFGERKMKGAAGQKRISTDFLKSHKIPLPTLNEQKRIAAILDKADALRRKRKKAIALTDDLLHATFLDMFGDPVLNPKGWETSKFSDLIKLKSGKFLPAKSMVRGDFNVYGGNGINGQHSQFMFEESVIVIGRVGAYCGAVHKTTPRSWITDNALYISSTKHEFENDYIEWCLRFLNLNQYSSQAGQPLISEGRLRDIMLCLPPIELQKKFSHFVSNLARARNNYDNSNTCFNNLFISLSHNSFSGDL